MSTDGWPEDSTEGDAGRTAWKPTVSGGGGRAWLEAGSTGGTRSWSLEGSDSWPALLGDLLCEGTQDGGARSCLRWWGGAGWGGQDTIASSTAVCPGRVRKMLSVCSVKQDTVRKENLHPCLTETTQRPQATPCTGWRRGPSSKF